MEGGNAFVNNSSILDNSSSSAGYITCLLFYNVSMLIFHVRCANLCCLSAIRLFPCVEALPEEIAAAIMKSGFHDTVNVAIS
jgi:hypothetical protein